MIIKSYQSNFDFSTQINGDVKSVLDFCLKNEVSLTEKIPAGEKVERSDTKYKNELIINYFQSKNSELATSEPISQGVILGIGNMKIESDFDIL